MKAAISKALVLFTQYFPWVIIFVFLYDMWQHWGNNDRVMLSILGALGWLTYVQCSGDLCKCKEREEEHHDHV